MKKMMTIVITIIAMMFVQDVFAQAKPQSDADKAKKEQLMQTRLGMLKDELKLTDAQAVKFEPIYREYRKEIGSNLTACASIHRR